ncbi:MAG: fumarylacetoacetate hydrolase family protein [Pseudomonadota bacterium]|nr:fumarylacetoacetate hydrolase family protein [Pseudomonadota bacterium]
MTRWVRYTAAEGTGFGSLDGNSIRVFDGDLFDAPRPTGAVRRLADVRLTMPVRPTKIIALWNNFHTLIEKMNSKVPAEPLYFIKAPNTYLDPGQTIRKPVVDSRIIFEGELAVVIGREARSVAEPDALDHVFGYTCANDVTAVDILTRNPEFAQWCRAKGYDTFCPFGPAIATDLDLATASVKTILNGGERQRYPLTDMVFSVPQLVSRISRDMTLYPGDMILCGTSVGVGVMKPGSTIEVEIEGIGRLTNRFE